MEPSDKLEKRNRVHSRDVVLMGGTAIFFDTLQAILLLIPFLGWILSALVGGFAWLVFYTWTSAKGWGLSDTVKQFIVQWAIPLVEIVPILNVLPTWTFKIFLQVSLLKAEDKIYNATEGKVDLEKIEKFYKKVA